MRTVLGSEAWRTNSSWKFSPRSGRKGDCFQLMAMALWLGLGSTLHYSSPKPSLVVVLVPFIIFATISP